LSYDLPLVRDAVNTYRALDTRSQGRFSFPIREYERRGVN